VEKIEAVSVVVEDRYSTATNESACSHSTAATGNLLPLLHEVRHALQRWLDEGETHIIDLRAMPMSPDEEERLLALLGQGEVRADLSALGRSEIVETTFPGVWLVTHCNEGGTTVGRFIEVCAVPDILMSQSWDGRTALARLDDLLSEAETTA
jgi:hydrogenase-1 operon protein HyaF